MKLYFIQSLKFWLAIRERAMRFNAQKHHRGMHSLSNEPDHQVLARARLKGLLIHPSVLDSTYLSSSSSSTARETGVYCKSHGLEACQSVASRNIRSSLFSFGLLK
jgi:hypothetical protein